MRQQGCWEAAVCWHVPGRSPEVSQLRCHPCLIPYTLSDLAQSTLELAAMAPGTMLCDYSLYVCTFLAIAGAALQGIVPATPQLPAQRLARLSTSILAHMDTGYTSN